MDVEIHVLAHFVEPLDHFGIGGDAQVLALFQQQLLVDQVAENVLVALGDDLVGIGRVLLLRFLLQCSLLRWYSVRVMIWLLTRAIISSTTVSGTEGEEGQLHSQQQAGE